MRIDVPIVYAFVDGKGGGNPAGVVLDAEQYSKDQKQRIAAAVGLSETAFVSPSSIADFKLEFFTPTRQIAHCGHATIATFSYLRQEGVLSGDQTSKETKDGRREILMEGTYAFMEQVAPRYEELGHEDRSCVLDSLGLESTDLLPEAIPLVVNTGNSFLVMALRSADAVESIRPDSKLISAVSEQYDLIGYYIFSREVETPGRDAGARMFAPRYGIEEEPATGMAAGPLACYLHDKLAERRGEYLIEQGNFMTPPSPSLVRVRLETGDGNISSLMAGGEAMVRETRQVRVS